MSTHRRNGRSSRYLRRVTFATAIVAALAIAAPVAQASAAARFAVPAAASGCNVAVGGTYTDTIFNGPTQFVVS